MLERQCRGLQGLVAGARSGTLPVFEQVLVAVHQDLVRDLVRSRLPFERVIQGRYRVRITTADVRFEDGLALVRLGGRGSFADRPEAEAFVDVEVAGSLEILDLDRASGVLRGRVRLIGVAAHRVGVMGVNPPVEKLVEDLGRQQLASFDSLWAPVEIPVRLRQQVDLPAVGPDEGVTIDAATIPLVMTVARVVAFDQRLWISVDVRLPGEKPS